MKVLLLGAVGGAVGVLALQALLVVGYLTAQRDDPILLNPDRGFLDKSGVAMVAYCGRGGKEMLDKIPSDGNGGPWSKGRTLATTTLGQSPARADCAVWYHHPSSWRPCNPGHCGLTFDERPCRDPCD
jgi:hypothetical protein